MHLSTRLGVPLITLVLLASSGIASAQDDATWVTGSMQHVDGSCSETGSSDDGGGSRHSYECTQTWTSSDPRLTGDASRRWNEDSYQQA
jgi:hypothetical protein